MNLSARSLPVGGVVPLAAIRRTLDKTFSRTARFIGNGLALRDEARPYAPLVYALLSGAVWLVVGLVGEPGWFVTIAAGLVLLCLLAAVCAIDARFGVIPDSLVVALAVGGGVATVAIGAADLAQRVGEAGIMLVAASLFRCGYFRARGLHGLGLGDVKLMGAGVLWTGLSPVSAIILIAVASAFTSIGVQHAQGETMTGQDAIAFGPHLAVGIWLAWIASTTHCCDGIGFL